VLNWARWVPISLCIAGLFLFGAGLDEPQHAKRILVELALCMPAALLLSRYSFRRFNIF
jgi:hypothetical protein